MHEITSKLWVYVKRSDSLYTSNDPRIQEEYFECIRNPDVYPYSIAECALDYLLNYTSFNSEGIDPRRIYILLAIIWGSLEETLFVKIFTDKYSLVHIAVIAGEDGISYTKALKVLNDQFLEVLPLIPPHRNLMISYPNLKNLVSIMRKFKKLRGSDKFVFYKLINNVIDDIMKLYIEELRIKP